MSWGWCRKTKLRNLLLVGMGGSMEVLFLLQKYGNSAGPARRSAFCS